LQISHLGKIQDHTTVSNAVTRDTMAATANGERQAGFARQREDAGHLLRVPDPDDDDWAAIHPTIEKSTRPIVISITGRDHPIIEPGAKL
jgi:hypothetical protein